MAEERETAYFLVYGFLAVVVASLFVAVLVRQPNSRVTVILTHPAPSQRSGVGN